MEIFGKRLKELRQAAKITQAELAQRLNIHLQTVSKWERGLSEPDISLFGDLAAALGVTLEGLCGQEEAQTSYCGAFRPERFGRALYEQRVARSESQEQLAEAMGVSCDAVSRWERGVTCPDAERLCTLAAHYRVPVSLLYCGAAQEQSPPVRAPRRIAGRILVPLLACVAAGLLIACILLALRPAAQQEPLHTFTVTLDGRAVSVSEDEWFAPAPASRDGYDFLGWADESGEVASFPSRISENRTYTALFSPTEYSVEYWLNGGYFRTIVQDRITVESGSVELPVPHKDGQTFEGWYLAADYSGEPSARIACSGSDIRLYAKWSDVTFTVRYELQGGALYGENPSCVTAAEAVPLAEPVRTGYLFLGWFDQPGGGERYASVGGSEAKNLTLYALWQRSDAQFTVYYDDGGGEGAAENPVSVGAGEVHRLKAARKAGHEFVGWNTAPDGSGEYVEYLCGLDGTLHLYAVYRPKEYVVRYIYEGEYETAAVNPSAVVYGEQVRLLPVVCYGHVFDGWYTCEEGGERIEVINQENILTIATLYARFTPLRFTVTLKAGTGVLLARGSAVSEQSYTISFGEELVLPACALEGHDFLGWNEQPSGGGEYLTTFTGAGGDCTLYAVYEAKEYLIRYSYEGIYEAGKVNPNYITYGERVTLNPVWRTGYQFTGWFTCEEGGERIEVIDASNVAQLTWLYARFEPLLYRIALDAAGGQFETPEGTGGSYTYTVAYNDTFVLPACMLGGYVFCGWMNEEGVTVTEINEKNICDMRLTATWRASDERYSVIYVLDGGEQAQGNPDVVLVGQVLTLHAPTRAGHLFLGWYDSADARGTRYTSTPADRKTDLTLYAIWQEIVESGSAQDFTFVKSEREVTITGYSGAVGENVDVVIPALVDGLPVTKIGSSETVQVGARTQTSGIFGAPDRVTLRSLTIPEGVTLIKEYAFCGLHVKESVQLPSTVTAIAERAFLGFQGRVLFSDAGNLVTIGAYAFSDVAFGSTLVLPYGLKTIENGAFYDVDTAGIILSETVEVVMEDAFYQPNRFVGQMFVPSSLKYLASTTGTVYTTMTQEALLAVSSVTSAYTQVGLSTLTLTDGATSTVFTGYAFDLPQCTREGETFIGWQDANGDFVSDCFIPCGDAALTAVYQPKGEGDGRSAQTSALCPVDTACVLYFAEGAPLYFTPDVQGDLRIVISYSCEGRTRLYRLRGGEKQIVYSGTAIEHLAGDVYCVEVYAPIACPGASLSVEIVALS